HGNAHDPYCMPEHFLAPCKEVRGRELGLPLSSKVLRYFANKYMSQFDIAQADTWNFHDFIRWVLRIGNPLQIAADYFVMMWRVLYPIARQWLRLGRAAARAADRAIHRQKINRELQRFEHTDAA